VFWGFPPISLCVPVMGKTEVESSTQISDFPKNGFKFFSQISNSHFFRSQIFLGHISSQIVVFWAESLQFKSNLQMCSDRNLNSNCDWDLPSTGVCIHLYVRASLLPWRHAWVFRLAYHRLLVCHLFRDDCCEMRAQRSQHAAAAVLDYCQYRVCTCGSWRDVVWPVLAWDGPDCVICSEQVPSNCASWWWSADWVCVCVCLSVCLSVCMSVCLCVCVWQHNAEKQRREMGVTSSPDSGESCHLSRSFSRYSSATVRLKLHLRSVHQVAFHFWELICTVVRF